MWATPSGRSADAILRGPTSEIPTHIDGLRALLDEQKALLNDQLVGFTKIVKLSGDLAYRVRCLEDAIGDDEVEVRAGCNTRRCQSDSDLDLQSYDTPLLGTCGARRMYTTTDAVDAEADLGPNIVRRGRSSRTSPVRATLIPGMQRAKILMREVLGKNYNVDRLYNDRGVFADIAKSKMFKTVSIIVVLFAIVWIGIDTDRNKEWLITRAPVECQISDNLTTAHFFLEPFWNP